MAYNVNNKHSSDMKKERLEIYEKVANGELTPEQADEQLLSLFSVRLSLLARKIVEAYKEYDKSCYYSHTAGEEPSYHYRNGIEWVMYRLKKVLGNEA
jgi:hypothetical protein